MCAYVLATTAVSGREKETRRDITIDTCAYLLLLLVYVYVLASCHRYCVWKRKRSMYGGR